MSDLGALIFFGVILLLLSFLFVGAGRAVYVRGECLAYSYPAGKIDWQWRAYCIKRVDQTDVVVPLAEARRGRALTP